MSKRKSQKISRNQILFRVMLGLVALSMVFSLIVVALPEPKPPVTPTPLPTWAFEPTTPPEPLPTATAPAQTPSPTPTVTTTEPVMGPELPTATATLTPTLTPSPTETPAGAALEFAVAGDSRGNPSVYRALLAAVMESGSEFLVHTGDLVNQGTAEQWAAFEQIMADFTLPFYPVPGNHDGLDGSLEGYLASSGAPAAHYSFDYGPVHLTMADSHNGGIGAGELAWLRDDLSTTGQPIKMVFLHHPPFDPDGTDHTMAYGRKKFMDLMAEQEVDYVFAGHIHAYSRAERDGVTYIITGGAGAPLYGDEHPQAFYHYLRVLIQDLNVTVQVIKIDRSQNTPAGPQPDQNPLRAWDSALPHVGA